MTVISFPAQKCTGLAKQLAKEDWEGVIHALNGGVKPDIVVGQWPLWQFVLRRIPKTPFREQDLSEPERDEHALVQRLLRAIVNGLDEEGKQDALAQAMRVGRVDFAVWLVHAGADARLLRLGRVVDSKDGDVESFGYDARIAALNFCIAKGANPDAFEPGEPTPLMRALLQHKTRWAHALLTAGADANLVSVLPDGTQRTPLEVAIQTGQADCVAALLMAGATTRQDSMATDCEHLSLGEIAAGMAAPQILNLMLAQHGRGDLHRWLRAALTRGHFENALWCLDAGADLYMTDRMGRAGAHYAAKGGNERLIRHLLHLGVSMRDCDREGACGWDVLKEHHPQVYARMLPSAEGRNVVPLARSGGAH